ncbi:hypothetical protein [Streptomyces sp. NRRL S-118]|nr:hypothetical protein [Streptomyces sp. NRRL S-118]
MSRHTRPACHGRPMKLDPKSRQWVCARCGGWTTRLWARIGGAR